MEENKNYFTSRAFASVLLRIGLAIVFLYAAIGSFLNPDAWIGYFPVILQRMVPKGFLLGSFSIIEIVLSIWLLAGKKTFYAAIIAALMLAGIILANFGAMDIVFRDFGILFAALALAALSFEAVPFRSGAVISTQ
jgi:uncharacterized membrane protein YphA (DoxX/SURF4 family)